MSLVRRVDSMSIANLVHAFPRTHPDRLLNATDAEKRAATEKFQVKFGVNIIDVYPSNASNVLQRPSLMPTMSYQTPRGARSTTYSTAQDEINQMTPLRLPTFSLNSLECSITHRRGEQVALARHSPTLRVFSQTSLRRY